MKKILFSTYLMAASAAFATSSDFDDIGSYQNPSSVSYAVTIEKAKGSQTDISSNITIKKFSEKYCELYNKRKNNIPFEKSNVKNFIKEFTEDSDKDKDLISMFENLGIETKLNTQNEKLAYIFRNLNIAPTSDIKDGKLVNYDMGAPVDRNIKTALINLLSRPEKMALQNGYVYIKKQSINPQEVFVVEEPTEEFFKTLLGVKRKPLQQDMDQPIPKRAKS